MYCRVYAPFIKSISNSTFTKKKPDQNLVEKLYNNCKWNKVLSILFSNKTKLVKVETLLTCVCF